MDEPKFVYGVMHFEDGVRPCLMQRGTKYYTAICVDSHALYKRMVLFTEIKYFQERANSDTNLRKIKVVARFLLSRSVLTGMKREMPKAVRKIMKEALAYEVPNT